VPYQRGNRRKENPWKRRKKRDPNRESVCHGKTCDAAGATMSLAKRKKRGGGNKRKNLIHARVKDRKKEKERREFTRNTQKGQN